MHDLRTQVINEGSTAAVLVPFVDAQGAPIADGAVTSLTVTLRDMGTQTLIRDTQSVLNTNGGVLSGGVLTLTLSGADTAALGSASMQPRVLTVDLQTASVRITDEVLLMIRNLRDIT